MVYIHDLNTHITQYMESETRENHIICVHDCKCFKVWLLQLKHHIGGDTLHGRQPTYGLYSDYYIQ
jgi:hypothetical protein